MATDEEMDVDYVERQKTIVQLSRDYLTVVKESKCFYADKYRSQRDFEVGDRVMFNPERIAAKARAELLTNWKTRFIGPRKNLQKNGNVSYRI